MTDAVEEKVLAFIREMKPQHAKSIASDTDLIGSGILDSLAVLQLVMFLAKQFAVTLPAREVTPANLRSVATIAKVIEARRA